MPTEVPTDMPTDEPTPEAASTAEPPQIVGYGITIGDGAYVRSWPDYYSAIMDELPPNMVVFVNGQTYVDNVPWHQIEYGGKWGYVRADMLRMMGQEEVMDYLDAVNATPEPTAAITLPPYSGNNLSSYGYTTAVVNFREGASTASARIRQLKKYALCLVLGTTEVDGVTWYRVTYAGNNGYINGNFFKHMTLDEMEAFLKSQDYLDGIANNAGNSGTGTTNSGSSGSSSSTEVVSAEDQKVNTWTNPDSGIEVSYEPFDPFATAAPLPTEEPNEYLDSLVRDVKNGNVSREQLEALLRAHYQGEANQDELVAAGLRYIEEQLGTEAATDTPEPSPESLETAEPETVQEQTEGTGAAGWIIGAAAVMAAGGGGYVWYTSNQRRRKEEAAAARKRAAQTRQRQEGTARPQQGSNGTGRTGTAGRPAGSAAASSAYRRPAGSSSGMASGPSGGAERTGTGSYTARTGQPATGSAERNGDYTVRPGHTAPASTDRAARPASGSRTQTGNAGTNPYARYSAREDEEDAQYTASFRPQENRNNGDAGYHRRRRNSDRPDDGNLNS